jgi:hypothetical protein
MAAMSTDFDSFFRNKIESLLIKSSWVKVVQKKLSLEAVSQVWGERPEWYFWIGGAPGVYSLALADAETVAEEDHLAALGRFSVKCFPYPHGAAFNDFSAEERAAVNSSLFDSTYTPLFEARDRIQAHWFTVGSISILLDAGRHTALLTYDSLERMVTSRMPLPANRGADTLTDIRNIAGWEVGYPLFDCLVGLYAFYALDAPCFAGATLAPGFKYVLYGDEPIECRPSRSNRHLAFSVLFSGSKTTDGQAETYWRRRIDPEEKVAYTSFFSQAVESPLAVPEMSPATVNPLWWDLPSGEYKSELASTCGCADHDHHCCSLPHLSKTDRS